ncbi:hypothetical protein EI94DRAFT_1731730 [Lactarius quietus]|nr:hypothetical protein EI94DRAFT_1731730 [Lactarius quietus]
MDANIDPTLLQHPGGLQRPNSSGNGTGNDQPYANIDPTLLQDTGGLQRLDSTGNGTGHDLSSGPRHPIIDPILLRDKISPQWLKSTRDGNHDGQCHSNLLKQLTPLSSCLASEQLKARFTLPSDHQMPSVPPNAAPTPSLSPLVVALSSTSDSSPLTALKVKQLQVQCRARGLPIGGTKAVLVARLSGPSMGPTCSSSIAAAPRSPSTFSLAHARTLLEHRDATSALVGPEASIAGEEDLAGAALQDMASLESSYQHAIDGEPNGGRGAQPEDDQEDDDVGGMGHHAIADNDDGMAWVDSFILNTRHSGGRQTEMSVLKTYKAWLPGALRKGIVRDSIIDANHMIHYLKYAATRCLFTKQGREKESDERLSAQSLKKIVTMLGRIRRQQQDSDPSLVQSRPASNSRCQDYIKSVMIEARRLRIQCANFDVTKGTLLEYELRPEQFTEVTTAIFNMDKVPSIVKSLFSWNWQSVTLNRGDELVNLPLAFLQPYAIHIPDFNHSNGKPVGMNQSIFGVLSMFWDTKTVNADKNEPTYNFVVPHRDPLRCAVGALAIMLHFMFDQGGLVGKTPGWDWANALTWRGVHLMFGRAVDKPMHVRKWPVQDVQGLS